MITYSVSRRTPEFGLRMALGARRIDVLLLVLRQAMVLTLSGAVLGMVFALLAGRVLRSMILRGEFIGSAGSVCDRDGPCGLLCLHAKRPRLIR